MADTNSPKSFATLVAEMAAARQKVLTDIVAPFEARAVARFEAALADLEAIRAEAKAAVDATGIGSEAPPLPAVLSQASNLDVLGPLGAAVQKKRSDAAKAALTSTPTS